MNSNVTLAQMDAFPFGYNRSGHYNKTFKMRFRTEIAKAILDTAPDDLKRALKVYCCKSCQHVFIAMQNAFDSYMWVTLNNVIESAKKKAKPAAKQGRLKLRVGRS